MEQPKTLEEIIEQYKKVLRMDYVPELIIENPFIINYEPKQICDADMEWAIKAKERHEKYYGTEADEQGYKHYEVSVMVSTKEEDFSIDKMCVTIINALHNDERYILIGPGKF